MRYDIAIVLGLRISKSDYFCIAIFISTEERSIHDDVTFVWVCT